MNAPEPYQICLAGHLSELWESRFEGLHIERTPEGETILSGLLDQSALHGVLKQIRDLNLKIISVKSTPNEKENDA